MRKQHDTLNTHKVSTMVFWVQASWNIIGRFQRKNPQERTCFSETSVLIYYIIRHHVLEGTKIFFERYRFFEMQNILKNKRKCTLTFRNLASSIWDGRKNYPLDAPFYIYSTNNRTEYFKHGV
jgi:hypothetical protein